MDRVLGMLATALGDPAGDGHFARASAIAIRGGIRPEFALVQAEQAAGSQPPVRSDRLADAIAQLDALGMKTEADHYRTFTEATRSAYPAGLTEREVEVLILVAQGLTNRQIGERLSISEKTVTNHLTHVFTKADLDNRSAAVAFALRHGLAS